MDDKENLQTSEREGVETSKVQEALNNAQSTAEFEKRKLTKLLEYVQDNYHREIADEEFEEIKSLEPSEIKESLDEILDVGAPDEDSLVKVVELHQQARLANKAIQTDTENILQEIGDLPQKLNGRIWDLRQEQDGLPQEQQEVLQREIDSCFKELAQIESKFDYHNQSMPILNDVERRVDDHISTFFRQAGTRAADNINSAFLEFGRELMEDEELNRQVAELEGKEPDEMFLMSDYDGPPHAELLGGITQDIALDAVKAIRPDKLIEVTEEYSPIKHFIGEADTGVYRIFDEMYDKTVYNAPATYNAHNSHLTQKWVQLKTLPRFREIFTEEQIEAYEADIRDNILKEIVDKNYPQSSFTALEPLRSFEVMDIVLICSQESTLSSSQGLANTLLQVWSMQEGWDEFRDEYIKQRDLEKGLNAPNLAQELTRKIAYDKESPKFKVEFALKHMSDQEVLKWGHDKGLVEEVNYEDGEVVARGLHRRLAGLVKEKYQAHGYKPYDEYDTQGLEIQQKIDQIIAYKKLIIDSKLGDNNRDLLNNPKIVETYVLNGENFKQYSDQLMQILKHEGELVREFSAEFSILMANREGDMTLENVRTLKRLRETQSPAFFEKALRALGTRQNFTGDFGELTTKDGYLKPEFFETIKVDNQDVFLMYEGSEEDGIPIELWEAAFRARGVVNDELLDEYMEMKPELKALCEKIKKQSEAPEYASIVGPHYWSNHRRTLAYLYEAGIRDFNFEDFRHVINDRDVTAFVNGEGTFRSVDTNLEQLIEMQEKLGININNITVFDRKIAKILDQEIQDPNKANFYRRMLAEGKGSFKNLVTSIETNGYDVSDKRLRRDIETAVRDLGNISPILLDRYIHADNIGRAELKTRIKRLSESIRRNEPLLTGNESEDDIGLLAEQISIVFPGNNYDDIKELLQYGGLADKVQDLAEYEIREDGYTAKVTEKQKVAVLPEGKEIRTEVIDEISSLFAKHDVDQQELGQALNSLLKRGNNISYQENQKVLPTILATLPEHQVLEEIQNGYYDLNEASDLDAVLGKVEEATGIFFDDNIETSLLRYIYEDEETVNLLQETIKKGQRSLELVAREIEDPAEQLSYLQALGELVQGVDTENPDQDMSTVHKAARIAEIVHQQLKRKVFEGKGGLHSMVEDERGKLEYVETEEDVSAAIRMKGFISKNAASFFSKGTAGICTSGDVELYMRDDHFHINLFDGDTAIGNIQAYKIEHEGRRALLFRGFNPSTKYVNRENAPRITEGMVSIVKQFAQDNGIEDVFIAEQLEGWHALTNRSAEGVYDYFEAIYLNPNYPGYEKVEKEFPITSSKSIKEMYRIPME